MLDIEIPRKRTYKNDTPRKQYCRKWYYKLRKECITAYGGKCECCGEIQFHFLTIDHINGGGRKHRGKASGTNYLREIRKLNFPTGYRVLCYNCNSAMYTLGYCPHKKEIE